MKIYYGLEKIRKFKNPVVVLGIFDGVHLAHKKILVSARNKARQIKGTSVFVTFWPHPQKEGSLYSLEHRLKLIAMLGIDAGIVINFNKKFSRISAEKFVKDILVRKIRPSYIYIGKTFTFGKNAAGGFELLKKLAKECGFKVKVFKTLKVNGRIVSSTIIRKLIKAGKLDGLKKLLTRQVCILGTVIKGDSFARKLGYPTANIDPHHEVLPPSGVYAVKVIHKGKKFSGVCSIGHKPTFTDKKIQHIEVNIFNFHKNIYGANLEIEFIKLLRKQEKFPSAAILSKQIGKDVILAKKVISRH